MSEQQFTEKVITWLAPFVSECEIATKKSVLYALSVDEDGKIQISMQGEV